MYLFQNSVDFPCLDFNACNQFGGISCCGQHKRLSCSLFSLIPVKMSVSTGISRIAGLPSRQFRTMLRLLAKGLHIEQATQLIVARSNTQKELLADDVNTLVMLFYSLLASISYHDSCF